MVLVLPGRAPLSGLLAVTIGREEAREAAQRELSKPVYHQDDPPLVVRGLTKLFEWLQRLLTEASAVTPGGYAGLFGALALLVLVAVAIRLRVGPMRRSPGRGEPLMAGQLISASEHRARAERHAAAGDWAEALREQLRAVARALEERGLLEPRAGRTAGELATEAGAVLPGHGDDLRAGARLFDDVVYGGRAATPEAYEQIRGLDARLRASRPVLADGQAEVPDGAPAGAAR